MNFRSNSSQILSFLMFSFVAGLALARPVFSAEGSDRGLENRSQLLSSASQYREQGLAYRRQARWRESIDAFQKAVELSPQDVSSHILLGWTLHLNGQDPDATRSLLTAVYLKPSSIQAFNALGIVFLVQGELPQAILTHTWAVWLKPDNEIAHYNLSLAYQRQGLYDWSIFHAQRAASLESDNPHPFVAESIAYWDSGDRTAAIKAYRQATSVDRRYNDAAFLDYLKEAGFSPGQIQTSKQVLAAAK